MTGGFYFLFSHFLTLLPSNADTIKIYKAYKIILLYILFLIVMYALSFISDDPCYAVKRMILHVSFAVLRIK